ncbi:Vacuolar inheritance and morphology protein [Coemansia sp. RSA 1813]|nr:Vacuolar inheritance and morphology protein [Coemansia sp. RSA 1646]KAJ1765829.1 Vacuolar inheritance and morphology protein [Coemansia sp. RSA 1843]KAJ2085493.1 Vacuolar inheritance and morphology protein [Coemansia sp. RSA 986]KAJ2217826.1 Vacuolar inheritance and morphology protein [Coemansia sp. RSA 487]KAJ2562731.1 Vacuolar inheritance and morphology protein [Coemansia sp. RSA 1813]
MSDNDENQHKTMIKQLTDLDDNALDEQAGLFMHPRRKSLRSETTPRPLSQPFFQPQQVFPDVLNVSAMVERQEQRDQNPQVSRDTTEAQSQLQSGIETPITAAKPLTAGILGPGSAYLQDPQTVALLAQYPQGLALHSARSSAAGEVKYSDSTTSMPNASSNNNNNNGSGSSSNINNNNNQKGRTGFRSVSLTRMADEHTDSSISGRHGSGSELHKRDGAATAGIQSGADTPPMPPSAHHILRGGTPADTPTDEGERQFGAEGSRPSKANTKRPSRRIAGASSSDGRGPQSRGGRLFSRRANNPSSRGSDDENNSDDEEQFIYHNSRSSLHVSSIPEENYDDREPAVGGKRRPNRHRLSTHMGGTGSIGGERRDSAGMGRMGGAGGVGSNMSTGSYSHVHTSSSTVHSAGNVASVGGSGSGRPSRRLQGRMMRGGGGSVNTGSAGNPNSYSGYGYGGTSITATNSGTASASINNGGNNHGHRFSILTHTNNDYGMSSEESDVEDEPAGLRSTFTNNSNMYSRRNSRRFHSNVYYGSSEEMPETTPLFRRHYSNQRKRKSLAAQIVRATLASVLVLGSLFILVALFNYTSAPLVDVEAVKVTNILATEKELLFILHVQATNPNIREVLVERAEIGVFAAAAVDNNNGSNGGDDIANSPRGLAAANETEPAILLGNVYELSDPMRFAPGSLQKTTTDLKTTQISIHHPGASLGNGDEGEEGNDASKWRRLLKGPYDLTIRGTLQYTLWQRNYASRICIAKLANLPPDTNTTTLSRKLIAAGLGCDEGDDDDTIILPSPPVPPFVRLLSRFTTWY